MKKLVFVILLLGMVASLAVAGDEKPYNPKSKVCGYIHESCGEKDGYRGWNDILFELAPVERKDKDKPSDPSYQMNYTEPFYMVILASRKIIPSSDEDDLYKCKGTFTKKELKNAQEKFDKNRVFAGSPYCDSRVQYTNTNPDYAFLAVFAGRTKAEASKVEAKAKAHWKTTSLRRTQAGYHPGCLH